ncbi:unnamed protein product [Penicillium olsonii]|nr:unnamed protein product [Penicillium olsonii]
MLLAYKHGPKIHTRSITSGKVQHVLGNNVDRLAALDFSPDGRLLASASEDRTVRLWDCAQGESQNTLTAHPACKEITRSVTVSHDGQVVATASELPISKDGVITRVWDIKTGSFQIISREMLHGSPFTFSPDGRLLALSTFSKGIRLWNVNKRTHGIRLSLKSEGSRSIVFSPDSSTLAVCIDEAHILIWDLKANKRRKIITSTNYVRRPVVKRVPLFFSPCGKHIACGIGQEIRLYDVASGTEDIVLKGHSDEVSALAFSPDGNILASAGWDGVFNLWDMSTQKPRRLTGPSNQPDTLCFSPNGTFVACASLVRYSFWDVASGALLGNGDFDMWSKHFAFSSCGAHFLTDRGAIGLSRSAKLPISIFASQGWFWKGGVPFLYIHPDWRNSLQFVCGDIAVFLSMSGEPLVLRLGGHMGWEALK